MIVHIALNISELAAVRKVMQDLKLPDDLVDEQLLGFVSYVWSCGRDYARSPK